MLLGRVFAYSDTHRHRIGPNYLQLPVNRPHVEVQHLHPGRRRWPTSTAATTRSTRRTPSGAGTPTRSARSTAGWETDGAMVRQAYTLREDDDDFSQAGTLVREVWDDEQREAFVKTVAGHLLGGVEGDVLERAFQYWHHVDADCGKKIEELVREGADLGAPGAQPDEAAGRRERPDRRVGHQREQVALTDEDAGLGHGRITPWPSPTCQW